MDFKIEVKRLCEDAIIPVYASLGASGMDLYALVDGADDILLKTGSRVLLRTGIAISIPDGFEGQIRPRSGLAFKHGITVLNTPATIDSDYRGEIKILLANFGDNDFIIKPKMRIAQLVISNILRIGIKQVDSLTSTPRGDFGFGSTGIY